jgi:hypothetical protein
MPGFLDIFFRDPVRVFAEYMVKNDIIFITKKIENSYRLPGETDAKFMNTITKDVCIRPGEGGPHLLQ